jgi:hypothetical protein
MLSARLDTLFNQLGWPILMGERKPPPVLHLFTLLDSPLPIRGSSKTLLHASSNYNNIESPRVQGNPESLSALKYMASRGIFPLTARSKELLSSIARAGGRESLDDTFGRKADLEKADSSSKDPRAAIRMA